MTLVASSLLAIPALSHHSDAGLDMSRMTTLEGTVTQFNWRNPHVYFTMAAPNEDGEMVEWDMQMSSTITVSRMGWTPETLAPGDHVIVQAHLAVDGRPYGLMQSIRKEGGTPLPGSFDAATSEPVLEEAASMATTTTIEGLWLADSSKLVRYPGGFDGFFRAELSLNDKAREAQAAYDELSVDNPESTCVGRPTPGMIHSTTIYPMEFEFRGEDVIMIRSEFFDEERTVYMDGREYPGLDVRPVEGYSIGHWEGETLVVDTRNFADHRSPYQIGVPSGAQKRVVERYTLLEGGSRMLAEYTLEDPEYLTAPMTHSRELVYSPHMTMSRFDCDPDSTSRFVTP